MCGASPAKFDINETCGGKWAYGTPNCCGEWMFEFRNHYTTDAIEQQKLAGIAWNNLPRGLHDELLEALQSDPANN